MKNTKRLLGWCIAMLVIIPMSALLILSITTERRLDAVESSFATNGFPDHRIDSPPMPVGIEASVPPFDGVPADVTLEAGPVSADEMNAQLADVKERLKNKPDPSPGTQSWRDVQFVAPLATKR